MKEFPDFIWPRMMSGLDSGHLYWQTEDKKTLKRINKLLQELLRDGAVRGIGKAALLRHAAGMSRRIDDKNRLIYVMEGESLVVLSCRGHCED